MSQKLYEENSIQDIANAIRSQNGTQDIYKVAQMGDAIRAIKTQPNLEPLIVNQNGTYTPSQGKDGFSSVAVNVEGRAVVQPLSITQNGTYNPPSGVDGYAPITVHVSGGGGGNLYTNRQIYLGEQITDVSDFTLLYNGDSYYGNRGQKVAARLAITDESVHSTLQAQGWIASGMSYYDVENQKGAYAGYDFGQAILITKAKFWLNRFSGQNKTLIATVEYLDKNGNWNELKDLQITTTLDYPSYIFEVDVNRNIYGIRWIHKKDPIKTPGNNITFAGMTVYRGIGQAISVYIPDSSGLNMPPSGYDGFGSLYIVESPSEIIPSLPYSDQSKILASAYPGNYNGGSTWDTLEVGNTDYIAKNLNSIDITNGAYARLDLGEINHSCVAYFVGVAFDSSAYPRIVSFWNTNSYNNEVTIDTANNIINYTHYGITIATIPVPGIHLFACALRIDGDNKMSSFFFNGAQVAQSTAFANAGRYCTFGCSSPNNNKAALSIYYAGVVDGAESDSTIISNLQYLMNFYGIE